MVKTAQPEVESNDNIKTVLYFNADTPKGPFAGQIELSSDNVEGYTQLFNAVVGQLVKEAEEDDLISFSPRPISYTTGGGGGKGTTTTKLAAPSPDGDSPTCGIHNVPMNKVPAGISKKTEKPYNAFYACGEKDNNGNFCTYKPPK